MSDFQQLQSAFVIAALWGLFGYAFASAIFPVLVIIFLLGGLLYGVLHVTAVLFAGVVEWIFARNREKP